MSNMAYPSRARPRVGHSTNSTRRFRYYSVPEAGELLGTGERFVRRLVAERRIGFHKFGAKVRISHEDLEAYIVESRVEAEQ